MSPYDLAALTGIVSLGAGLWWMWPPLALVVLGVLLVIVSRAEPPPREGA